MKNMTFLGVALCAGLAAPFAWSAGKIEAGPHGGRLMKAGDLRVEFHVGKDRKARIYLYNKALKAAPADSAKITLKALKGGSRTVELKKVEEDPKKKGSVEHWAGKKALPTGDGYVVSLSVKVQGEPVVVHRFNYLEEVCGGCDLPEYACTCGH